MDTERLQSFAEVARQGSVTRAAQRLRVQQPTLSHRLAALEREVGTPLFERLGTGPGADAGRRGAAAVRAADSRR